MANSPSKFGYDISIFNPEPPTKPLQVKSLFCGRDAELARGLEQLRVGMERSVGHPVSGPRGICGVCGVKLRATHFAPRK